MVAQAPARPYGIGAPPKMTEEAVFPPKTSDSVLIGQAQITDPYSVIDPKFASARMLFTILSKSLKKSPEELYDRDIERLGIEYLLVREQFWAWAQPPERFAPGMQQTHEVSFTQGYEVTTMKSFTESLQVTVGVSGFDFDASVQAGLQMEESRTQQWSESRTVTDTLSFTAGPTGSTVLAWTLIDEYTLYRTYKDSPDRREVVARVPVFTGIPYYDIFPAD